MERFVRGDVSRHSEGSGLGLSIVHDLVENNGGQIRVETKPGTGSLFSVSFPLFDTEADL